MMKLLFLSFLQKKIKTERTCKELLKDIVTLAEKLEITKKPKDDLKLIVQKKVLLKISD